MESNFSSVGDFVHHYSFIYIVVKYLFAHLALYDVLFYGA